MAMNTIGKFSLDRLLSMYMQQLSMIMLFPAIKGYINKGSKNNGVGRSSTITIIIHMYIYIYNIYIYIYIYIYIHICMLGCVSIHTSTHSVECHAVTMFLDGRFKLTGT